MAKKEIIIRESKITVEVEVKVFEKSRMFLRNSQAIGKINGKEYEFCTDIGSGMPILEVDGTNCTIEYGELIPAMYEAVRQVKEKGFE